MSAYSLLAAPAALSIDLQRRLERSPTARTNVRTRSFGDVLEPRYIIGADPLDQ